MTTATTPETDTEGRTMDAVETSKQGPVRWLTCACCGEETRGRQWPNRDTGYGVCVACADRHAAKYGEGTPADGQRTDSVYSLYGVRGVHFDIKEA